MMPSTTLVYLHGREGGPFGARFQALSVLGHVVAPDCSGTTDLQDRLTLVDQRLHDLGDLVIVGSAQGGLAALLYAGHHQEQVKGLVLLAPSIHLPETDTIRHVPSPTILVHHRHDESVPESTIFEFTQRFKTGLLVLDNDAQDTTPIVVGLAWSIMRMADITQ